MRCMNAIKVGDNIFKIMSFENELYVQKNVISKVTERGVLICGFIPHRGLKISAIDQFTRTCFAWWSRGKELNEFNCFSLEDNLERNILLFRKRFKKVVGFELPIEIKYI